MLDSLKTDGMSSTRNDSSLVSHEILLGQTTGSVFSISMVNGSFGSDSGDILDFSNFLVFKGSGFMGHVFFIFKRKKIFFYVSRGNSNIMLR